MFSLFFAMVALTTSTRIITDKRASETKYACVIPDPTDEKRYTVSWIYIPQGGTAWEQVSPSGGFYRDGWVTHEKAELKRLYEEAKDVPAQAKKLLKRLEEQKAHKDIAPTVGSKRQRGAQDQDSAGAKTRRTMRRA